MLVRMPSSDLLRAYRVGCNMRGSFAFPCLPCAEQLWKEVQSARGFVEELAENLKLGRLFRIGLKVEEELNDFYRERLVLKKCENSELAYRSRQILLQLSFLSSKTEA